MALTKGLITFKYRKFYMSKFCQNCQQQIPAGRLKILPSATTCVKCSSEEKWGAIHIINHKTGNDVQVMKDAEAAKKFAKLSSRVGFGTLRGMRAGTSAKTANVAPGVAKMFTADPEFFERIGARMMEKLEFLGEEKARKYVTTQVNERAIDTIQGSKLMKIIDELTKKEVAPKPVRTKPPKYNPYSKFEPFVKEDPFAKEINDAFRNWRK